MGDGRHDTATTATATSASEPAQEYQTRRAAPISPRGTAREFLRSIPHPDRLESQNLNQEVPMILIKTSILLALIVNVISCAPAPRNTPPEEKVPSDFSIVCGQGGGFTGAWEGHTVRADGSVLVWKGMKPEQDPQPAGVLTM